MNENDKLNLLKISEMNIENPPKPTSDCSGGWELVTGANGKKYWRCKQNPNIKIEEKQSNFNIENLINLFEEENNFITYNKLNEYEQKLVIDAVENGYLIEHKGKLNERMLKIKIMRRAVGEIKPLFFVATSKLYFEIKNINKKCEEL